MTLIVKTKKVTRHLLRTKTTQEKRKKKRKNQKTTIMRLIVKDSRNLTMMTWRSHPILIRHEARCEHLQKKSSRLEVRRAKLKK